MVPRGLTTCAFDDDEYGELSEEVRRGLRDIRDYDRTGSSFISHDASDLDRERVARLKANGAGIICWTIRSRAEETAARKFADNITFEGYAAPLQI